MFLGLVIQADVREEIAVSDELQLATGIDTRVVVSYVEMLFLPSVIIPALDRVAVGANSTFLVCGKYVLFLCRF